MLLVSSKIVSKFTNNYTCSTIISCKIFNKNTTQPITRFVLSCVSSIVSWYDEKDEINKVKKNEIKMKTITTVKWVVTTNVSLTCLLVFLTLLMTPRHRRCWHCIVMHNVVIFLTCQKLKCLYLFFIFCVEKVYPLIS